jgi:hypothetical protein
LNIEEQQPTIRSPSGGDAMCTKRDIEDILKQIGESHDPDHIRRLLEEINACSKCPENLQYQDDQDSVCRCRLNFHIELKNHIYAITNKK